MSASANKEHNSSGSIINKAGPKRIVLVDGSLDFLTEDSDDTACLLINGVVISFPVKALHGSLFCTTDFDCILTLSSKKHKLQLE